MELNPSNALSTKFEIQAFVKREPQIEFACGDVQAIDKKNKSTKEENGTVISYVPDDSMPKNTAIVMNMERMLRYYTYLNRGLTIRYNGKRFRSKDGLKDLLQENISETLYPIIYIEGNDITAFTHLDQYGEDYFSFVNGQHTTQGGTHHSF